MAVRFTELVVDCRDPAEVAAFWAAVLGWPAQQYQQSDGEVWEVAGPSGTGPSLVFVPVPEPKSAKNRLHLDLNPVGADQAAEVERLVGLGARPADVGQGDQRWVVLADVEGNEFCVLGSRLD